MKNITAFILTSLVCFSAFSGPGSDDGTQRFDVLFGVTSIDTDETLEGFETTTIFSLNGGLDDNFLYLCKTEYPDGEVSFFISGNLDLRISIDGVIFEDVFILSDEIIKKLLNCKNLAIQSGGKVYRFSDEVLKINYFGFISEYEHPLAQIKAFLNETAVSSL
jgi:hypothetical protein